VFSRWIGALVFALSAASAPAAILYSQPCDWPDGPYSDGVPGQLYNIRIADYFTLAGSGLVEVETVRWCGSSENAFLPDLTNVDAWVVEFFNDQGGLPDKSLRREVVLRDDAAPMLTGAQNSMGGLEHTQTLTLDSPLSLSAGVAYWIAIGADLDGIDDDAWIWSGNLADGDNLRARQNPGGAWSQQSGDVAFELIGRVGCPQSGCEMGDFDGDCDIDISDLAFMLSVFGTDDAAADFDDDGLVGLSDLAVMLNNFGHICD